MFDFYHRKTRTLIIDLTYTVIFFTFKDVRLNENFIRFSNDYYFNRKVFKTKDKTFLWGFLKVYSGLLKRTKARIIIYLYPPLFHFPFIFCCIFFLFTTQQVHNINFLKIYNKNNFTQLILFLYLSHIAGGNYVTETANIA